MFRISFPAVLLCLVGGLLASNAMAGTPLSYNRVNLSESAQIEVADHGRFGKARHGDKQSQGQDSDNIAHYVFSPQAVVPDIWFAMCFVYGIIHPAQCRPWAKIEQVSYHKNKVKKINGLKAEDGRLAALL